MKILTIDYYLALWLLSVIVAVVFAFKIMILEMWISIAFMWIFNIMIRIESDKL